MANATQARHVHYEVLCGTLIGVMAFFRKLLHCGNLRCELGIGDRHLLCQVLLTHCNCKDLRYRVAEAGCVRGPRKLSTCGRMR